MTNFATFIDTGNGRAPIAQRGKAKQKRADLRLVGLGLVVTRDGGVPLLSHAYPGSKPDVTQFPQMMAALAARHAALAAAAGQDGTEITILFDARRDAEASSRYWPARTCTTWARAGQRVPRPARGARFRPHRRRCGRVRPADRL